jgi:predicted CopG family antitoxin
MTTITIEESAHRKLKKLKEKEGANSFNELINNITDERLDIPSSEEMFGSMSIEDKEDIRDHDDRADRYD